MVRELPIEVIASWPTSNLEDPERRGSGLIILTGSMIAIVSIFVLLRLYVRIYMLRWVAADDVFMVLAYLSVCGMTTCVIYGFQHDGWVSRYAQQTGSDEGANDSSPQDRHIWDVPFTKYEDALYLSWWTKIVFASAACFTRMSLLMFYWYLTRESSKRLYRLALLTAMVISVAVGIALILINIFQCVPIRAFWTFPPIPDQRCLDEGWATLGCGVANNVADIVVVALPILLIARLQLPLRQRAGAIILISLGLIVCVAGGARTYFTWFALIDTYDYTWNGFGIYVSAMIEVDLGVICACAPALRVFVLKMVQPRVASLVKVLRRHPDLTSLSLNKDHESTIDSTSRLRSREEMQLAAMYAYHPSQVPSPIKSIEEALEKPPPCYNITGTLAPPPTDAQIIRANLRKTNIIHFQPRRRHRRPRRRHSTYEAMPRLDENSTDIDLSKSTRRKSLTSMVAQTPANAMSHIAQQFGGKHRRHSSVVDLNGINFLDSPTIMERPSASIASSEISGLPIHTHSPEASPPQATRTRSDTLRIPDRTLKSFRGLLFDIDGPYNGKMRSWTAAHGKSREEAPMAMAFFDQAVVESRAASPVTRYVRQQHSVLQSAIAHDRERLRLSQEQDVHKV